MQVQDYIERACASRLREAEGREDIDWAIERIEKVITASSQGNRASGFGIRRVPRS